MIIDMLAIARVAGELALVNRITLLPDGSRESDTDHSIMLAVLAATIANQYPVLGCDPDLTAAYAVVHDYAEVISGDFVTLGATPEALAAKQASDDAATIAVVRRMASSLWFVRRLVTYHDQVQPEARLVRYVDKIVAKLTHALTGCKAVVERGMSREELIEAHIRQGSELRRQYVDLAPIFRLFDEACALAENAYPTETP